MISGSGSKVRKSTLLKALLPSVKQFKKVQSDLCATWCVSYTKLKYMNEMLWETVKYTEEKNGTSFWDANSLTKLVKRLCHDQLKLCVEPFMKLNGDGDIRDLYESYPKFIRLICTGNKLKIVRACYFLLGQIIHWIEKRPDILQQIAILGPFTNEIFVVELHNSVIARRIGNIELSFQNIRDESADVQFARNFFSQIREALDMK